MALPSGDPEAAVVVWGGGSGGVAAALQAARAGASTLLLTPGPWLGGMVSAAGVCAPDGNELTPWQTGLWGALLRALAREEPTGLDHNWVSCFGYRPATAEAILRRWLAAEPLLRWWPGCVLREVERRGDRIEALRVERHDPAGTSRPPAVRLRPQLVIDGSDRGDLLPLADAPFRLGWEAQETWQEPSAPTRARLESDPFFRRQPIQSPTWVAIGRLQRTTGGHRGERPTTLPAPFSGASEAFGLERTLTYGRLPGDLVMLNWPLHGNDWHQGLERAFGAAAAAAFPCDPREHQLAEEMRRHSLAFCHALEEASGGQLRPAALFPDREQARRGELQGRESLALMPYWREGRRLVGRTVVLEQDLLPRGEGACIAPLPLRPDGRTSAIAVGNYANDHHYPGGDWPLAPKSCRWGGRWSGTPFCLPYDALVSDGVANLLAADKCLSVSHMANGATRLQPLILNLGQAAGMAAALCIALGVDPADLPVGRLQRALVEDPQAPAAPLPLWDTPWHHPRWRERLERALEDPSRLTGDGRLKDDASPPPAPPAEPGERLWQGDLLPGPEEGRFHLRTGRRLWPVITLEPCLHEWLQRLEAPRRVSLVGCLNPWGPWLRASRLAGDSR